MAQVANPSANMVTTTTMANIVSTIKMGLTTNMTQVANMVGTTILVTKMVRMINMALVAKPIKWHGGNTLTYIAKMVPPICKISLIIIPTKQIIPLAMVANIISKWVRCHLVAIPTW
ncbi:hypothetical protein Pyn_17946 [Prunus yedoensis var. nudiflora]|uniref:Uncharacterized protein n=1 Tax=Prunus yedoensis var. nudiflora TaxID=2094558 RepID=A0A314YSH8_PRUYE|nr:hypothetical protein Pyn_17946 [Prunus yedoensis var. nudiflora]